MSSADGPTIRGSACRARSCGQRLPGALVALERGDVMVVNCRNVDASFDDKVTTWPFEALVACIEYGLVGD